jgi:hypothetical protein
MTTDESSDKKLSKRESQQGIGKVKNLKMNFEAKANSAVPPASGTGNNNKSCQSLPSSPIAIHIDVSPATSDGFPSANSEDIKTLIDHYDGVAKMRNIPLPNARQRPKSLYETKFNMKTFQPKPALITHQTIFAKNSDEFKRPPIPSYQPTVKNALMTSNQNVVVKSVGNCRKIQQHGKTHPLSKLVINKQRLNTSPATAYNTM